MGNILYRSRIISSPALELTWDDIVNAPVADASSVSDWNTFFDLPTNGSPFTSVEVVGNVVKLRGGSGITLRGDLFNNTNPVKFEDNISCVIRAEYACLAGSNLEYVKLPVCTYAGNSAFSGNTKSNIEFYLPLLEECSTYVFTGVCVDGVSVESKPLNLPSLHTAGQGCFSQCYVPEFILPELVNIETGCFYQTIGITEINLPKVNAIPWATFNESRASVFILPEALSIEHFAFNTDVNPITELYIPKCINIGMTTGNDNIFADTSFDNPTITIPVSLMTCNEGGVEGDIQYIIDNNTVTIFDPANNQIYP